MSDPILIPSGATALELIQKIIIDHTTPTLVPGTNIFMGYESDTPVGVGLVYLVMEGAERDPDLTMGTIVAIENYYVHIAVYGDPNDFTTPKQEAMRLRYTIAQVSLGYQALGLRMMYARPIGTVTQLGKDAKERHHFMIKFHVTTEPSYQ
jgi:hypothetical protein